MLGIYIHIRKICDCMIPKDLKLHQIAPLLGALPGLRLQTVAQILTAVEH
ncbi:MAG: hypothetical protein CM15mP60_1400 [Alphaproteobacteria bacterium]|nr:MAG: hypothetical protein CM15mP60_1400 [Alphaproteobacteria bacterium]